MAVTSKGPPPNIQPQDLWDQITTMPRPYRIAPFPRKNAKGEPIGEIAFVVLTDPGQRQLFWETTSGPDWRGESQSGPLTRAPVVIVPLANKHAYLERYALPDKVHTPLSNEAHWPAPYWDIDTGFGVMMILLTAVELGLGALFFGIFAGERALMDVLGVPEGFRPIGAIAVGHPTPGQRSRPELPTGRRRLDEVVRWERW